MERHLGSPREQRLMLEFSAHDVECSNMFSTAIANLIEDNLIGDQELEGNAVGQSPYCNEV
ncbi:unnamed protein product [Clonostachys rhizophaga]|uniref:Uncharacterized protein n=1 Tax=Clonostachys rhizophaga TaxID=160324 RepID=A0A9N9YF97_9HYPO|nr:unnamed protein product [Clonostachys rhizophaga]